MKSMSNKYIRSIFQNKFVDYEADLNLSWEKVEEKLFVDVNIKAKSISKNYLGFIISIALMLIYNSDEIISPREIHLSDIYMQSLAVFNQQTHDCNNLSISKATALNHQKAASILSPAKITAKVQIENDSIVAFKNSSFQEGNPHTKLVSFSNGYSRIQESTFFEMAPVNKLNINFSDSVQSAIYNNDLIEQEQLETKTPLKLQLTIKPFYNTCTFIPILNDNARITKFNQSSSTLENRLGIAASVGINQTISKRLELEYTVGYNVFSKYFDYTNLQIDNERTIAEYTKTVKGQLHSAVVGINVISLIMHQRILFSLEYNQLIGNKFKPYISNHLIYYGIGFERNVGTKFKVRPNVQLGTPMGKNFEHFKIQPMNWGIEVVMKIKQDE